MRDSGYTWLFMGALFFLILSLAFLYQTLYNFDDGNESGNLVQNDLFYSWQNRKVAKLLSLLTSNSRIYRGFIFYDAWNNPINRPRLSDWKGLKLAVVGEGMARGESVYQGVSRDTFNIRAVPKKWDPSKELLVVEVGGGIFTLRTDRSTLVYELSVYKDKTLIGRGSGVGKEFLRGDVLQLFVVDEGQYPLILDGLVLLP